MTDVTRPAPGDEGGTPLQDTEIDEVTGGLDYSPVPYGSVDPHTDC